MPETNRLPSAHVANWDWQLAAACRDTGSSVFFHPEGEISRSRAGADREAAAKDLCARCRVQEECLRHALAAREPYGVWGGLNPSEREGLLNSTKSSSSRAEVTALSSVPVPRR